MTAPRGRGQQATARGVVVLVAAVLIGLGLLAGSDDLVSSPGEGRSPDSDETTTTTTEAGQSTVVPVSSSTTQGTTDTKPPGEVTVLVVNATGGQAGVGSANNAKLSEAGYQALPAKNGPPTPNTTVYFAEGYQADAEAVKAVVGLTTAPVQPAPAEPIIAEAADANVVVVAGQDYSAG